MVKVLLAVGTMRKVAGAWKLAGKPGQYEFPSSSRIPIPRATLKLPSGSGAAWPRGVRASVARTCAGEVVLMTSTDCAASEVATKTTTSGMNPRMAATPLDSVDRVTITEGRGRAGLTSFLIPRREARLSEALRLMGAWWHASLHGQPVRPRLRRKRRVEIELEAR